MTNQNPSSFKLTHLFLITAVFAMVAGMHGCELQLYKVGTKSQGADAVGLDFEQGILITCAAIIQGCAFVGGLFLAFNYLWHKRTLRHPGHWFLAIAAIFQLFDRCLIMTATYHIAYFDLNSSQYIQVYFWTSAVIQLLVSAAWITITVFVAKRFGKMWWLTFGLFTALNLEFVVSQFVLQLDDYYFDFTRIVLLMAIIGSIGQDVRQGEARDWLHWFGVLFTMFELGFYLIWSLNLLVFG